LFGTFTALNFFHWFLFWELGLVPAFFLIRCGAGRDRRRDRQFFVLHDGRECGPVAGFLGLFVATGTFEFAKLAELGGARAGHAVAAHLAPHGTWGGGAYVAALHGCVPRVCGEVPVVPSTLAAGHLSLGTRRTTICSPGRCPRWAFTACCASSPIFPAQMRLMSTPLCGWRWRPRLRGGGGLRAAGFEAMLAYSSITTSATACSGSSPARRGGARLRPDSERAAALSGVCLQMFNHGLTAALLFWFVDLLERRRGSGQSMISGVRPGGPVFCGLMGIAIFSSLGLPGSTASWRVSGVQGWAFPPLRGRRWRRSLDC